MKRIGTYFLLSSLIFYSGISWDANLTSLSVASANVSDWQKGVILSPENNTDFSSERAHQTLQDIKGIHANYVVFIIPYAEASQNDTTMYPSPNTPTDDSLGGAIDYAHSLGLKVTLNMHLDTPDGGWRANINPSDRDGWFSAYNKMLDHFIQIAQAHAVEDICIGTELIDMTSPDVNQTNTQHWTDLIKNLRKEYSGNLTYSANRSGEVEKIAFWSDLDYIGISAYYELWGADGSVNSIKDQWASWDNQYVSSVAKKFNKPVVFTEAGYRSIDHSYQQPWDWQRQGSFDEDAQANSFEGLFEYWSAVPSFHGLDIWEWQTDPNAGGQGNLDYTPQHKKAENTISNWFSRQSA